MTVRSFQSAGVELLTSQQVLDENQAVFSLQQLLIPARLDSFSADDLRRRYYAYLRRCFWGIIKVVERADGVDFCLGPTGLVLLGFTVPRGVTTELGDKSVLRLAGGLLVQPGECDRGQLEFIVERDAASTRISLQLSDYCPLLLGSRRPTRLRKWLYRLTQASIHKLVTLRFLRRLFRQLTGKRPPERAVEIALRRGEKI